MHPKDRRRHSGPAPPRSGVVAAVAGAGGLLAALREHHDADRTPRCERRSPLVVPKPTGPGGLPLPRPDNAVTWAITDDNQPIADGLQPESGPLQRLQLRRLHRPGARQAVREAVRRARSQIATYNSADEAIAKLAVRRGRGSTSSSASPARTSST